MYVSASRERKSAFEARNSSKRNAASHKNALVSIFEQVRNINESLETIWAWVTDALERVRNAHAALADYVYTEPISVATSSQQGEGQEE